MGASGPGIFENDAALEFIGTLREGRATPVGDRISAAVRAVGQAEQPLTVEQVQRCLAALALLLSDLDAGTLDGAPNPPELLAWFADLEIELNPARRLIAAAAISRVLLPSDNRWRELWDASTDGPAALGSVVRLRDLLADSAPES